MIRFCSKRSSFCLKSLSRNRNQIRIPTIDCSHFSTTTKTNVDVDKNKLVANKAAPNNETLAFRTVTRAIAGFLFVCLFVMLLLFFLISNILQQQSSANAAICATKAAATIATGSAAMAAETLHTGLIVV